MLSPLRVVALVIKEQLIWQVLVDELKKYMFAQVQAYKLLDTRLRALGKTSQRISHAKLSKLKAKFGEHEHWSYVLGAISPVECKMEQLIKQSNCVSLK